MSQIVVPSPVLPPNLNDFIASADGYLLAEDVLSWSDWCSEQSWFRRYGKPSDRAGLELHANILFLTFPEFRSLCDYRTQKRKVSTQRLLRDTLPRATELHIQCEVIGPRFRIQHGFSTIVLAREIGSDFWVNQNVTIGSNRGTPHIGNNVRIRTGAVVVGQISIGDNVDVNANAVVNENISSNHAVYAARAVHRQKKTASP